MIRKKSTFILAWCISLALIISVAFATSFSDTFDKATPSGQDDPSEADDRMREIKAAVQERENVDHVWALTGTEVSAADTGEHRKITYNATISDPTPVASKSHLYMQNDELRYRDDSNAAIDLTSGGKLGSASTDLTVNDATVAGTLGVTGVATIGDGSLLATSAAPTTDAMIANKKSVDDSVDAAQGKLPSSVTTDTLSLTAAGSWTNKVLTDIPTQKCLVVLHIHPSSGSGPVASRPGNDDSTFLGPGNANEGGAGGSQNIGPAQDAIIVNVTDALGSLDFRANSTMTLAIKVLSYIPLVTD